MTDLLTDHQIDDELGGVPRWTRVASEIHGSFRAGSFVGALAFVNAVGALAESAGHHPDIDIRYDRVNLSLSTHDAGGLTGKDFSLARQIDIAAAGLVD
ncbi:4a-hydroxytetrahydrobiopterin dehydratase [Nakamurella sp. PAMC28650]|jgi:4a-hydroxytetrahydrobiopterin dehydratase|uniref:4a-hydroxytetrahydrobiopterin dehydratase n=1 Tax=Nakamurella sp. PAMC28650 TaxID=2762325 RepID=UPI00164E0EAC|nr:4a-hydroxytetrahydrobiopterin dehydratase [Nakamurella sp. PAMC28650]QNK80807.1 4a-hydroxytetrahydrobiopterin dehydratase [Nakamurella sp. PAMC28650]